jgi:hypothetical protein
MLSPFMPKRTCRRQRPVCLDSIIARSQCSEIERMRREREAYADALATVEQFNARLSAKRSAWFCPMIAAALTSKHPWLVIAKTG